MEKKKIIMIYQPFTFKQNITVMEENSTIAELSVSLDRVPSTINALSSQYNCNDVILYGNKKFLTKFKEEMLTKYSMLNITIEE